MLESRPEDALDLHIKTVETAETVKTVEPVHMGLSSKNTDILNILIAVIHNYGFLLHCTSVQCADCQMKNPHNC